MSHNSSNGQGMQIVRGPKKEGTEKIPKIPLNSWNSTNFQGAMSKNKKKHHNKRRKPQGYRRISTWHSRVYDSMKTKRRRRGFYLHRVPRLSGSSNRQTSWRIRFIGRGWNCFNQSPVFPMSKRENKSDHCRSSRLSMLGS